MLVSRPAVAQETAGAIAGGSGFALSNGDILFHGSTTLDPFNGVQDPVQFISYNAGSWVSARDLDRTAMAKKLTFDQLQGQEHYGSTWWQGPEAEIDPCYGADAYTLTEEDLGRLRKGEVLALDAQGEYTVYLRLKEEPEGGS